MRQSLVRTAAAALVAGLWLVVPAEVASATILQELRTAWHAANTEAEYEAVYADLYAYRHSDARFVKTAELDYMIAVSLCHVTALRGIGWGHFDWILQNFSLGEEDQVLVRAQQEKCGQPNQLDKRFQFAMLSAHSGSAAEVRSKMFYWLGREDAALNTDPVEFEAPKNADELLGRLFSFGDVEAALAASLARLEGITRRGQELRAYASDNFVVVTLGRHDHRALGNIAAKLEKFLAFYIEAYSLRRPSHLVTVYLAQNPWTLHDLSKELHGLKIPEQAIGYTFRDDLSILGIIPGEAIGTLAHELFHLLVRDRFGDLPPFLDEGTAALYEVSNVSAKYVPGGPVDAGTAPAPMVGGELAVRGIPNWRGCVLKALWLEDRYGYGLKRPTVAELVTMSWRDFDNLKGESLVADQAVIHATARYFVLYLQDWDQKLFSFFADFAGRDPLKMEAKPEADALGRAKMHLGELDAADARFEAWLQNSLAGHKCND